MMIYSCAPADYSLAALERDNNRRTARINREMLKDYQCEHYCDDWDEESDASGWFADAAAGWWRGYR